MLNKPLATAVLIIFLSSCNLVYLNKLEVITYPSEVNSILSKDESILISFSEPVDHCSVESLFEYIGPTGTEDGDFIWKSDSVEFLPLNCMQPGFKYIIKLIGEIETEDGKSFQNYTNIPFYYLTDKLPPVLLSTSPSDAEIVNTDSELLFEFNKSIDQFTFESGFRLNPSCEIIFRWNYDGTVATISPANQWKNLNYYKWSVSSEATDSSGIPLPEEYSGSFVVQSDTEPPDVTGIFPAAYDGSDSFTLLTALTADNLRSGQHLAISFSEDIDFSSLKKNLSFSPSINGYILELNTDTAVYYIDEQLPPGSEYVLSISKGLTDISGNETQISWSETFTPAIPGQQISSIVLEDQNGTYLSLSEPDFSNLNFIDTPLLDYYGSDSLHFIVSIAEAIPESLINNRREFISKISLEPVFPPGTAEPVLMSAEWETENKIRLIFEDLLTCTDAAPVYYSFEIAEGSEASASSGGSYLLSEINFIFLAEQQ